MKFPEVRLLYLMPVVLAVLFLIAGVPSILHPLMYEKTPSGYMTRFHLDPTLYGESTVNASETSLSGMQDLIDAAGPLTLSIRVKDPESAIRDLQEYMNAVRNMESLEIKFELSESDLATYLKDHRENARILASLLNETTRFDQLTHLEIQFTDSGNTGQLTTVVLEKQAIRSRIREMYDKYRVNGAAIEDTAAKYALDPTSVQQSTRDFEAIVKEVDAQQTQSIAGLAKLDTEERFISLFIEPSSVSYGDVLRVWGISSAKESVPRLVRIFIDGLQSGSPPLGEGGRYEQIFPIEKIETGIHNVYAQDGSLRSEVETFTVAGVGSVTTLKTGRPDPGAVVCSGEIVTDQGRKVKGAPVEITWDGEHSVSAETGDTGAYRTSVQLPAGRHTLRARFPGANFPIGASESETVTVDIPGAIRGGGENSVLFSILIACGIILASGAGAAFYLRRKGGVVHTGGGVREEPFRDLATEQSEDRVVLYQEKPGISLIDLFLRLIGAAGLREAAFAVYRGLTARVERVLGLARVRSLTPRELAMRTADLPFHAALQDFIPRYEVLRYGPDPESAREAFESVIGPLDLATREGEDIRKPAPDETGPLDADTRVGEEPDRDEVDRSPPGTPSGDSRSGGFEWR